MEKQHDWAIITAYRRMLIDASSRTLDNRPQELKNFDKKRGVSELSLITPYRYTDMDNERRNRDLHASLLCHHYGIAYLRNNDFIDREDFCFDDRNSYFFVVNINDDPLFHDTLVALSEYYNQDFFRFGDTKKCILYMVWTGTTYQGDDEIGNFSNCEGEIILEKLEDYDESTIMNMMTADAIIRKHIQETQNGT